MALSTGSTFLCMNRPSFFLPVFHPSAKTFLSATKVVRPLNCIPSSVIYEPEVSRRRANYKPNIWDHDLLQSLRSDYQVSHSSIKTSLSLPKINRPLNCLPSSVIYEPEVSRRRANYKPNIWDHDLIQSLRSDYQDEAYAKRAEKLKEDVKHCMLQEAANPLAQLELIDPIQRLGMGHIFDKEIKGALNIIWEGHNKNDNKGGLGIIMISMLLLSSLGSSENMGIITFTCTYLKAIKESVDIMLANKLGHALELPLHWRTQRLEALWYLNIYENEENMNPTLLELAKLDFNMVQATHQRDLRKASSWWSSLGLGGKLSFSRDRITECFFLALGVMFEPQFGYPRVELAKVCQLITTIDDIYDVFGSLDELECFTDAVDRWDIKSIDRLPEYMKICFLAIYNTTNQMGYEILKDQGINIIPYLQKAVEKVRGDAPSSIDCYMKEANFVSEMDARNHIKDLIFDSWKKLNEEARTASPYPPHFINCALNLARVVHCIYQHGDGHTVQDRSTKDRLTSLLAQPIPLVVE
ncbi:terpene synthase 10-like protein isoform X2 [Cinnamomum micranthum f. kanehirae]|uniref:Terpene synthase 10-like protein isoform X2 n=1 Tax=Cinnamomum micranthum f. kanehirae TaxID=337451 RepID=A0A443Q484_9MAGN|nr:terpene synthase 10-like protein isoform X2 [Cinnamomum micranthum f. kanehirae]